MTKRINSRAIRRFSLHDETVAIVREMILDASLVPGERINEQALCEELGISRTPLREALKVLASEDLVELMPSQGSMVTSITLDDVEAMFEVMYGLELQVGRLAAIRASQEDIDELFSLHNQMLKHHGDGDRTQYFNLNQQIHLRLAECTGNRFLFSDYERYQGKIRRVRYLANFSVSRWDESAKEHEIIMQAVKNQDPDALSDILGEHLQRTAGSAIEAIKKQQNKADESEYAPETA